MSSKVEASGGLESQGYHGHGGGGFGSFVAQLRSKLTQKSLEKKKPSHKQNPTVAHLRGIRERRNNAISLPNIQVSKLREKTPKKLTQSLKLDSGDILGHVDCKYCKDGSKKRMVPSLVPSCMLPKLGGRVYQGSSGWEWSRKDYRIKQTKFSANDFASLPGGGRGHSESSAGELGGNFATFKHNIGQTG